MFSKKIGYSPGPVVVKTVLSVDRLNSVSAVSLPTPFVMVIELPASVQIPFIVSDVQSSSPSVVNTVFDVLVKVPSSFKVMVPPV